MNTILYFQSAAKTSAPDKLAGVQEITNRKGIHVQVIEENPTRDLVSELCDFWHPIGAIADCGGELNQLDAGIFSDLPAVFLGHDPATLPKECLHVLHDQAATARLAARELLETGFGNFAFVPFAGNRYWSDERQKAFCAALRLNGRECRVYDRAAAAGSATARLESLIRFVKSLPKPCAVFAANDKTAESVLAAAQLAGISIPDQMAVIGVDNYAAVCEHTAPPLTSIEPDFRRSGNLAALMLLAAVLAKGKWRGSRTATFGPLRVVRRSSTRLLLRQDANVLAALDLIRREACTGLRAAKVAALFPCSRRMADLRFSRATGHTILDEIHAVQLERAKELLKNDNIQLKAISDFCGFTNPNSLRKFFLKATGMTMTAWRNTSARAEVSY